MCQILFYLLVTGRICRRQLCRYCFYSRAIFGFFAPQGRHVAPIKVGRSAPPCQISPWSVQGWGFTAPKTEKNWNFTNIIAANGRVPCTIFTKFTGFMRVISLHNSAKFGCFISINGKIINNLLRRGSFQLNFRRSLAAKLSMGPKNVFGLKWWHITMQNLVEIARRTLAWEDETWCFSLFYFWK